MRDPAEPAFVLPVRVYYEDTDAGGVVYYANYLRFIERARTEWLRALGFEQRRLREDFGVVFAVHRIEARFERAARLDDALHVGLDMERCTPVRMTFRQTVTPAGRPQRRLFQARVEVACLDARRFAPRRMPRPIQEAVTRWMST
jgi:acyl-CoA thioester hydrolase